jgi:hypothetical protein
MDYSYVKRRISDAVYVLCTAKGDVRSRLLLADRATDGLSDNSFPDELKPKWAEIKNLLRQHGAVFNDSGGVAIGAIANTLKKIRNSTGSKIAEKIFELHRDLEKNY